MAERPKLHIHANALRSQRLRALLSQEELAAASTMSIATIKALEAPGDNSVRPETVRKLSRALGCSPDDISTVIEGVA